jgi:hypothetical protein
MLIFQPSAAMAMDLAPSLGRVGVRSSARPMMTETPANEVV